jgi:hypothetical protein
MQNEKRRLAAPFFCVDSFQWVPEPAAGVVPTPMYLSKNPSIFV